MSQEDEQENNEDPKYDLSYLSVQDKIDLQPFQRRFTNLAPMDDGALPPLRTPQHAQAGGQAADEEGRRLKALGGRIHGPSETPEALARARGGAWGCP